MWKERKKGPVGNGSGQGWTVVLAIGNESAFNDAEQSPCVLVQLAEDYSQACLQSAHAPLYGSHDPLVARMTHRPNYITTRKDAQGAECNKPSHGWGGLVDIRLA